MISHRHPRGLDPRAVAVALGAIAAYALATSLVRVTRAAQNDAEREAELDDWACSPK